MRLKRGVLSIVVTFNGERFLPECLKWLSKEPTDILAIDNASTDGTLSYLRSLGDRIQLIELRSNLGFGKANNIGLSYALGQGYEAVFLLNQDIYVQQDTIVQLAKIGRENSDYWILCPVQLSSQGTMLDSGFSQYLVPRKCQDFMSDLFCNPDQLAPVYSCKGTNAAAWFLPRQCLLAAGGFDPLFIHYGEDDDFSRRVLGLGGKIGVCPGVRVRHDRKPLFLRPEERISEKRLYARSLWTAKNPHRSAIPSMLACIRDLAATGMRPANWRLSRGVSLRTMRVASKLMLLFPRILEHRRICGSRGSHFLDSTHLAQ